MDHLNALKVGGSEKLIVFAAILLLWKLRLKFLFSFPNLKQLSRVRTWIELRSSSIPLLLRTQVILSFINFMNLIC